MKTVLLTTMLGLASAGLLTAGIAIGRFRPQPLPAAPACFAGPTE